MMVQFGRIDGRRVFFVEKEGESVTPLNIIDEWNGVNIRTRNIPAKWSATFITLDNMDEVIDIIKGNITDVDITKDWFTIEHRILPGETEADGFLVSCGKRHDRYSNKWIGGIIAERNGEIYCEIAPNKNYEHAKVFPTIESIMIFLDGYLP